MRCTAKFDGHWVPLPAAYLEYLSRLASHGLRMTVVEDMATEIYSSTGRQLAALLTAERVIKSLACSCEIRKLALMGCDVNRQVLL